MPLFAQISDMTDRFETRDLVQLTDEAGDGVIDEARVERALEKADALIRGYIAARHRDVSALAGHALLADLACDIAFAELWRTERPEHVAARRKEAIEALKAISAGTIRLDDGEDTVPPRPGQILTSTDPRRFGRGNLGGF